MAADEKDTYTSSRNEAEVAQDTQDGDENGADIESGGASAPSQEQPRPSPALDSDAIQAMTRSWTWGRSEDDDDDDGSEENESMSPPYGDAGTMLEHATLRPVPEQESTSAARGEDTAQRETPRERLMYLDSDDEEEEDEKRPYIDDDDPRLHPPVASMPPPDGSEGEDVNEKDAYRLPRRTAPARTSLLNANGENRQDPNAPFPPPLPRRMPDIEARPGAVAMHGRRPGQLPAWVGDQRQESPSNQNQSRRVLYGLPFRWESTSNVQTADVATANAVDNAEAIFEATSVSPDRTAKNRRIAIAVGVLGLLVIIVLSIALTKTQKALDATKSPQDDPRCALPVEEQDVFDHCFCFNTTASLNWTAAEIKAYHGLQALLWNESVISEKHTIDSCSSENQCMVWTANYKRRNGTDEGAEEALNQIDPAIQKYLMCLTYLKFDGRNWERNDSWIESENFCEWFGVSCSFLSRITGLDLQSNGLNGTFPSELRHMPFLRDLDLSRNPGVKGTIPRDVSQMSSLHVLDLSNTNMSGTIPPEIERLELLDRLVLSNNSFSGTIPINITELRRMRELYLDANEFTGTLHTELGKLTRLAELSVGNNTLTGTLPKELRRLQHLEIFRVHWNRLSGTIPIDFRARKKDGNGHVGNIIEDQEPISIEEICEDGEGVRLEYIEEIIEDRIDEIGVGWEYIEEINLSHNSFTGTFPSFLGEFEHLVATFLHDTQLNGSIPESYCKGDKKDQAIIILQCNETDGSNETRVPKEECSDFIYCIEELPPSLQHLA